MKDRDDRSSGIEILMVDDFTKINHTDVLRLDTQVVRRKRNWSDSSGTGDFGKNPTFQFLYGTWPSWYKNQFLYGTWPSWYKNWNNNAHNEEDTFAEICCNSLVRTDDSRWEWRMLFIVVYYESRKRELKIQTYLWMSVWWKTKK
jgi:hypothetical protein